MSRLTSSMGSLGLLFVLIVLAWDVGTARSDNKWGPHVEILAEPGSERTRGQKDLFIPLWQNENALFFTDLRSSYDDDENIAGSFGLGYRRMCCGWIWGGYGYFDITRSDEYSKDHTFLGGVLGVEAMNEDWDFRVNGYISEDDEKSQPEFSRAVVSGNSIHIENGIERGLHGLDAEIGWRLPFAADCCFWDTRVFVGGYYFDADHVADLTGPQLRLETRLYDLPYMTEGSRLTLGAGYRWD